MGVIQELSAVWHIIWFGDECGIPKWNCLFCEYDNKDVGNAYWLPPERKSEINSELT